MNINYSVFRNVAHLDTETALLEGSKNYLKDNILISAIGIIESFDIAKQEGIVIIPKYDGLRIDARVFSTFTLSLKQGDKVFLIQSSVDLLDEDSTNYFDKNNFYILSAVDLEKEFSIKAKSPIEISVENEIYKQSLKGILDKIADVIGGLTYTLPPDGIIKVVNPLNPKDLGEVKKASESIKTEINKVFK